MRSGILAVLVVALIGALAAGCQDTQQSLMRNADLDSHYGAPPAIHQGIWN